MKINLRRILSAIIISFAFFFEVEVTFAGTGKIVDDFNDLNTDEWVPASPGAPYGTGHWFIVQGRLHQDLPGDHYKILLNKLQISDQSAETRLFLNGPAGYGGITFWYRDSDNWLDILVYPAVTPNSLRIVEKIDGVTSSSQYSYSPVGGAEYNLRAEADSKSGQLAVYMDEVLVATHKTNIVNRTGKTGLNSGNSGGYFDYFSLMVADSDGDGVGDENDLCPDTTVDTGGWEAGLGLNRWEARADENRVWGWYQNKLAKGKTNGFDMAYTYGCSGQQMLILFQEKFGVRLKDQWRRGISTGVLKLFHRRFQIR